MDDFRDLLSVSEMNEMNITQFLGCFELIADKLVSENGGAECPLAESQDKQNFEKQNQVINSITKRNNDITEIEPKLNTSDPVLDYMH